MTTLRPMTTLGDSTMTIEVIGDANCYFQERACRDLQSKLSKQGIYLRRFKGEATEIDLTGKTVSTLVAAHKGILAIQKQARKDSVTVTVTYGGEATDFDLDAMVKQPTPADDHDVMRKIRNWSALSGAKILRALELMDLNPEPVKDGRKLVGFRFTIPGYDEAVYEYNYDGIKPNYRNDDKLITERYKAAKDYLVQAASDLLGLPNPNARAGLPTRARDYRTDLTIRTCPCCFRDIKASEHTNGLIADHGFTIEGRGWSGWGGARMGGCSGVGRLPWEKSCEPAQEMITFLLGRSDAMVTHLAALEAGEVTELTVPDRTQPWDRQLRARPTKVVTPADGYEWKDALRQAISGTRNQIRRLWDGSYGTIPWYRMAVRTWKPVADDQVAVGAPEGRPEGSDYNNKPEV